VSLAALVTMANNAFTSQDKISSYTQWRNNLCEISATACYWFTVMDLEILLFTFVYSIRKGDFKLFVSSLKNICYWMFTLDHVHYARWLPVFIADMENIMEKDNELTNAFYNVFFTVRKSNNPFSNMGID
jgi:hypothetical protein